MPDEPRERDSIPAKSPAPTPMQRLWQRYLKAKGAKTGLCLITAFALVAFLAPFLAHRLPLVWRDGATGETTFPLVREFFAPSDTTEPFLERGINFLLLFIPIALVAWRLMNRKAPHLAAKESRWISLVFGALFSAVLWVGIGGMVMQGGGNDWLHFEKPPVPEEEDFDQPSAQARETTDADQTILDAVRRRLEDSGALGALRTETSSGRVNDEGKRRIISPLQEAIDGPAILPVARTAGSMLNPLDITDANLEMGINTQRWNRMLVEYSYPDLLVPFRQVRWTFLMLVAASALVLTGLTYIFMAGANQFTMTPRWLVLLTVAFFLSLPFRAPARHDHRPYREMAAKGEGTGLFPLIPYGPNEQGFGPKLPPSWYEDSPKLAESDIISWDRFVDLLTNNPTPGAAHIAEELDSQLPDWRRLSGSRDGRERIVTRLNDMLDAGLLYDGDAFTDTRWGIHAAPYVQALRGGSSLKQLHLSRFNRLVLEKVLPSTIRPAFASRWKKPNHAEGVHTLGTDESGRDVLVRLIHGARVSLSVGFVSVFLATVIGLVLGSIAAYYGGKVDMLISRFMEIMMCFPSFFLILAVIAVLDKRSILNIMLVIGLTSWTGIARLIRGEIFKQKRLEYVAASVALGASDTRTIFRHILPNAMAPVLVSISFGITGAILTEASLSFIGFGVTPPTPTWGQLLSETRESPLANWWLAVFPGLVLFLGVLAYNLVGEALRDALDPRTTL